LRGFAAALRPKAAGSGNKNRALSLRGFVAALRDTCSRFYEIAGNF